MLVARRYPETGGSRIRDRQRNPHSRRPDRRTRLAVPDVIHSFWVPNIGGKLDMVPGQQNRMVVQGERAGRLARGQCAEFCGVQHANMSLHLVALQPADFAGWLAGQRAEAEQCRKSTQRPGAVPVGGLRRLPRDPRHGCARRPSGRISPISAAGCRRRRHAAE